MGDNTQGRGKEDRKGISHLSRYQGGTNEVESQQHFWRTIKRNE